MPQAKSKPTRVVIQDALLGLLEKKPLARITVADIIKAAHVNRSTFYYHYRDKEDVVGAIMKRATALVDSVWPTTGASDEELLKWFDDYTKLVQENRWFFRHLALGELFLKATKADDRDAIEAAKLWAPDDIPKGCDADLFIQAKSVGISWVVESWARGNCEAPREEILRLTWALFRPHSELKI